ncbi:acyl-CoA thioesterase [Pseudooceanicola sp. CBS1P-1]|uniref:Acyl-CoA thioesterase n=1 Tax=Pseudooceanicola albus TaxID=2692189 RepID=A0A6L7G1C4_9RHOB|nr:MULTISPECIES: thioesterase family protein [Pseudooceanicola]MBT9382658.1 acyl-CoA thioesterase [Pseudooceanicola endophyticus]MXN17197.1 acyl-CoA thioesterase [Pseudooceanicola albus]
MISVYRGVAHPWLCDVMGHLTTRHYMAMFDDASYHLLDSAFGWQPGTGAAFGWADVRHVLDYQAEVAAGHLLEIRAGVRRLGGSSATVLYEMTDLTAGSRAATLEAVSVHFDLTARRAAPIPEAMRQRAAPLLLAEAD